MKRYFFILICTFIYTFTPSPCIGQTLVGTLCSENTIVQAGKFSSFNYSQCKKALEPIRTLEEQNGNTCTCEALLNVAFELGISGKMEELEKKHNCENANFGDIFSSYASSRSPLEGKVFGGISGAFRSMSLVSSRQALIDIVRAVESNQVVAVSLNPRPIYDDYANQNGKDYKVIGLFKAHVLVIRALVKDKFGTVTHFIVIDSSGPERLYPVSYDVFAQAYQSISTRPSRGVYISNAHRKMSGPN